MSDDLPFMASLRAAYNSRQTNQFILTGNVFDVFRCPWLSDREGTHYLPLQEYLAQRLGGDARLVIVYNIATGIEFQAPVDPDTSEPRLALALRCYRALFEKGEEELATSSFGEALSKSSAMILPSLVLLRKICRGASRLGVTVSVVLEHCESLLPDRASSQMTDVERQRLIFFKEWLTDQEFLDSPHLVLCIAETSSAVHAELRRLPHMLPLHLPLPDVAERKRFLRHCLRHDSSLKLSGSQQEFAELGAGMTLLGMQQIVRGGSYQNSRVQRRDFAQHLNRLLESRLGDHIELVRPAHSMDDVVGNRALKQELARVTDALRSGDPEIAPVGILVSGPNGVGKTYVMLAWANACDRVVLVLKNLRGSLFGETDQIFEKIRNVLEVLGNVIILVDEADTVFARPGGDSHDTEQRLFGNVIKMMGDPRNRGRIVWVLMTARPDNLAPDLKRSGRCGLHLPIFDPEGEDREDFVRHVLERSDIQLAEFAKPERERFQEQTAAFSPADFRELSVELRARSRLGGGDLAPQDILAILAEHSGGHLARQRHEQTAQALAHCSRRSLIPPGIRDAT